MVIRRIEIKEAVLSRGIYRPHYNYQNFAPFQNRNSPITNPIIKMRVTNASGPDVSSCTSGLGFQCVNLFQFNQSAFQKLESCFNRQDSLST